MYTRAGARAPGGWGFGTVPAGGTRVCAERAPILELRDEGFSVAAEERRLGKRCKQGSTLAEAHNDHLTVAQLGDCVSVDDHGRAHVRRLVSDLDLEAARNDEGPHVQRVRGDE